MGQSFAKKLNLRLLVFILVLVPEFLKGQELELFKNQALESIYYLNRVRAHPEMYSDSVGLDLQKFEATHPLAPDPNLMQVAEERASDMARRNYFSHTSPEGRTVNSILCQKGYPISKEYCQYKTLNNFESICAGSESGIECINILLKDEGVDPPGHRIHLLGLNDFYRTHKKVGAALVYRKDSDFEYYFVIITAP